MDSVQKHQQKISTILLIIVVFLAGYLVGGMNTTISEAQNGSRAIGDVGEAFQPLYEAYDTIQQRYIGADEIDVSTLVDGAMTGMIDSLGDDYSSYMDAETYKAFYDGLQGEFEGIGVLIITNDNDEIEVVQVIKGTGAEEAGVLKGDVFVEVDGQNIEDLTQDELVNLVTGPAGTKVTITFRRGEELVELTITRTRFENTTVDYEILDNDIAYIKLYRFDQPAFPQIRKALEELDVNSRKGLIFDLRGDPGGLKDVGLDITSLFIKEGPILYESYRDGSEIVYEANNRSTWTTAKNGEKIEESVYANITVPIVVLVNEDSASASEFFAGAMQDTHTATIIGEVTFGKATVQTLFEFSNGGGARITIARYLLPSRRWIHHVGITPDITVELDEKAFGYDIPHEDDTQLQAAVDFVLNANQ